MGTHQQLLAQRGIYFKLYRLQYKDQELNVGHVERAPSRANADGLGEPEVTASADDYALSLNEASTKAWQGLEKRAFSFSAEWRDSGDAGTTRLILHCLDSVRTLHLAHRSIQTTAEERTSASVGFRVPLHQTTRRYFPVLFACLISMRSTYAS